MDEDLKSKGKTILQAFEIIKETYRDIGRLKNDFGELLQENNPSFSFSEEYSYGPNRLTPKYNHTYTFSDNPDNDKRENEKVVGLVIIFDEGEGNIRRVSLQDEPELWCLYLERMNIERPHRYWDVRYYLEPDSIDCFENKRLKVGGEVYKFEWGDDESEVEEEGRCLGYPLTRIKSRGDIKELIINKLFPKKSK